MSFLESMQQRYTTKKYDPSKKIDSKQIEELKNILRLTPSSINSQPWKFTFVSDHGTRLQLSEISMHNGQKIKDCDTVVVFSRIDNIDLFETQLKDSSHPIALSYYMEYIKPKPNTEIKAWFDKQVYLALGVFLSACSEMGIDATPMEGIEPENYDKVLGDLDHNTLVAVAIGFRDIEDKNQPSIRPKTRLDIEQVVRSV